MRDYPPPPRAPNLHTRTTEKSDDPEVETFKVESTCSEYPRFTHRSLDHSKRTRSFRGPRHKNGASPLSAPAMGTKHQAQAQPLAQVQAQAHAQRPSRHSSQALTMVQSIEANDLTLSPPRRSSRERVMLLPYLSHSGGLPRTH
jgi:hypothetical protein